MGDQQWIDVGDAQELGQLPLREVQLGRRTVALSCVDGRFGAISGVCNHVGGPLGQGTFEGEYVVCPWHYWKFHRVSGEGEPGYEADRVPRLEVKVERGRVLVSAEASSKRNKLPHEPHPLARAIEPREGPLRVLGISTTAMDPAHPRYSTSEALLEVGLEHARRRPQGARRGPPGGTGGVGSRRSYVPPHRRGTEEAPWNRKPCSIS